MTNRHLLLWLPFIFLGLAYAGPIVEADCEEIFYSGTGPIDLQLGCVKDAQDRDKVTDNMYGVLAVDGGGTTQGQYTMSFIPTKGVSYEFGAASGVVYKRGTWIIGYYPQYQESRLHLIWANPDNVNWKLTFYRKGR